MNASVSFLSPKDRQVQRRQKELCEHGSYTAEAVRFARDNGIELVGGSVLVRMLRDAQKDALITVVEPAEPICPRCGSTMVLRTAQKGDRAGKKFWGCSAYPSYRGIVNC